MTDEQKIHNALDNLYDLTGCSVGGPLHIVSDDGNCTQADLDFCRAEANDAEEWSDTVRDATLAALALLEPLTEGQREDVINTWWYSRWRS